MSKLSLVLLRFATVVVLPLYFQTYHLHIQMQLGRVCLTVTIKWLCERDNRSLSHGHYVLRENFLR